MEPVKIPIRDVLDLHFFHPRDIPDLLSEYISECLKKEIFRVRIIHGKGKGVQRRRTWAFLEQHPAVRSYGHAPPQAGGWGATVAELRPPSP
ncbi:DNA mismatch repair protein MutS [Candidatus Desulfarcum epimagneticum]|uniref:DNA mismatch repair protein MutS n=1 Tax=uncultured Desulfobacteraceae bacterium TaxID=218296 RepID=A0A484HI55_9BACT|nr:DNA mismatch repair protein MutS [uncultured Desulfobacteraceae bacterium]